MNALTFHGTSSEITDHKNVIRFFLKFNIENGCCMKMGNIGETVITKLLLKLIKME